MDQHAEGIRIAVEWIRDMPRTRVVRDGRIITEDDVRHVAELVAAHLEKRLELSEEPTRPDLVTCSEPIRP